ISGPSEQAATEMPRIYSVLALYSRSSNHRRGYMCRMHSAMLIAAFGLLVTGLAPGTVSGQSAQSARLVGKVTDESGGAMPGVTVTVKSPALQLPQLTTVTGGEGDYRLLELPPGVYSVAFERSGSQTAVRTDVHLPTGSAGRVDVVVPIGGLSETVRVAGLR